ncbi:MAG: amidohydrolase family protein [Bacteroidetes bacterium]|nr:amidohydrolase family protein [Bacteroidota bacterium]MBS1973212.1 amidohydrolase family protein [Bacteroidota bacterium]
MTYRSIDTHVHFWKYNKARDAWMENMKALQQDYLPEHLMLNLKRNGIDGCVAIQAAPEEVETRFLIELSKTHDMIKGAVGWIDLLSDNVEEKLHEFSGYNIIKGYRHIVQAEADDFLLRKDFQKGVRALKQYGYTYDILIYPTQLKPAIEFVSSLPDQKLVIDHCAKPEIRHKKITEWKSLMKEIAQKENVFCKVSGLFTEAIWKEWAPADFYPYLDVVFDVFGTDRLMFGSDWPVILVSGIYVQWKSLLEKYMENFSTEDKEKFFGLNAIEFYNLQT